MKCLMKENTLSELILEMLVKHSRSFFTERPFSFNAYFVTDKLKKYFMKFKFKIMLESLIAPLQKP